MGHSLWGGGEIEDGNDVDDVDKEAEDVDAEPVVDDVDDADEVVEDEQNPPVAGS